MTKQQENAIEQIKKAIPRFDFYGHPESYEIKKLEVIDEYEEWGRVIVYVETGRVEDEGTLAEMICRKRRQIFIGPRGGCIAYKYNAKSKKSVRVEGFFRVMNEGWEM